MKINLWASVSFVLALLLALSLFGIISLTGMFSLTSQLSAQEAGNKATNFINENLLQGQTATLVDVKEMTNNVYTVVVDISGQVYESYITKDGSLLFPTGINIQEIESLVTGDATAEPAEQQNQEYSEEDLEKISIFINCLAEKGVKIYGANWCGYTKSFVQTLGGFDIAAPIYIECTEEINKELCSQEEISGYPTIKINGEAYSGARTFEGLSEVTGCPSPEVVVQTISSGEASC